jgi:H+/Cl- antiporter ClcA
VKDPVQAHPKSREILAGGGALPEAVSKTPIRATTALGALLGGIAGGAFTVVVTLVLKAMMDFVSSQAAWLVIVLPLLGLALGVLVLLRFGPIEPTPAFEPGAKPAPVTSRRPQGWALLRTGSVQADITGDIVATAGQEERFPWRHAPARTAAILATVGSGAAMGTEAPAAYFGVVAGAFLGDRGRWWRRLLRPAALAGGAAGVAALMGIPLVGTAYLLELGRRNNVPFSPERAVAALIGGLVGWGINFAFDLNLIRLVVPHEPPGTFAQAVITTLFIGGISGAVSSLAGTAMYRAKKWKASPGVRLALGGLALAAVSVILAIIAVPAAASGPGGGAILWAENTNALPLALLAVALLRAAATTAAVAAGGCGGVFVPFLAIGDLSGRVFAPWLGVGNDLAGSAGAAGGISGGYRLPLTGVAMVLGVGGPRLAMLTGLATVAVAFFAGMGTNIALDRLRKMIVHFGRRSA